MDEDQNTPEEIAEVVDHTEAPAYGHLLTDGTAIALSIETLQELRPDLNDRVLRENGIEPEEDFVLFFRGSIIRGASA